MDGLDINVTREGDKATIALTGRLDTNTAPEFEKVATETIAEGATHLVVDMAQCEYVSSAGLRVIMVLQKSLLTTGALVFRGVRQEIKEVFDMTGFSKILTFEN